MSLNHGIVWWSELMTRDVASAMRFYGETCGWAFESMPVEGDTYHLAIAHGQPVAGIRDCRPLEHWKDKDPQWFTYIAVTDVDRSVEEIVAAGGTVLRPPFEIPDVGSVAIVLDPEGAEVGLMTPAAETDAEPEEEADAEFDEDNFPV